MSYRIDLISHGCLNQRCESIVKCPLIYDFNYLLLQTDLLPHGTCY